MWQWKPGHHERLSRSFTVFAILLATSAGQGCTAIPGDTVVVGAKLVPADQLPAIIAAADDKVQVMTRPTIETSACFPQMPVWVRRVAGVINTTDLSLYDARRLDEAYNRVAFIDHGRVGYCTPLGEVVIPPSFDAGNIFQEGIAAVQVNGKYGYIDQFGNWLMKPELDYAYGFWFGVGAAKQQGRYGLVDHSGQWIKSPDFMYMAAVGGGITAQSANGEEGFVDLRGNYIKNGPLSKFYHPPK